MDTLIYIMISVLSLSVMFLYIAVRNLVTQQKDLLLALDTLNFKIEQLNTKKKVTKKKIDKESE